MEWRSRRHFVRRFRANDEENGETEDFSVKFGVGVEIGKRQRRKVRLNDPSKYQEIVDAEWNIIYDKLEKCVQSGANVVLSRLAIGDLATQYFADRGLFCAGRVEQAIWTDAREQLVRLCRRP